MRKKKRLLCGRWWPWPDLRYHLKICLRVCGKNEGPVIACHSAGKELNQGNSCQHKAGVVIRVIMHLYSKGERNSEIRFLSPILE